MTAEEFLTLHGHESSIELVKGRVVQCPMRGGKHGQVCATAGFIIHDAAKRTHSGRVMLDTYVWISSDTIRAADVCYLSYTRLSKDHELPDGPLTAPDLVIEVRSHTEDFQELAAKAPEYIGVGVAVVVIVDPETQTVAVYRNDDPPVELGSDEVLTLPDVLPGFTVPIRAFFE